MIPIEVTELADLIFPGWRDLPAEVDNRAERDEILDAAWRIYEAGWQRPDPNAKTRQP